MKLIFFSTDANLLKPASAVRDRMEHYGTLVDGIDVILLGAPEMATLVLKNKVTVHALAGNKILAAGKALWKARSLRSDDTVISVQDPFELGLLGWLASVISRRPLHAQVHIDFFSPYFAEESLRQYFQSRLAPFVLRQASSIRVVSQKIATYIAHDLYISPTLITIAPVYSDIEKIRNTPTKNDLRKLYPQFDFIVVMASRFVKQKNILCGIDGFELFKRTHSKAGLVIVGSGPEEKEIKAHVRDFELEDCVKVSAFTDDFVSCMRTADAFLLSSDYEGWGMTVIEAAALGKSIIMTDVGCAGEFLADSVNGLVVPVRDPEAIEKALSRLAAERQFARRLGEAAFADASAYMTRVENDSLLLGSWKRAIVSA